MTRLKLTNTELLNLSIWHREKADAVGPSDRVSVSAHELRLLTDAAHETLSLRASNQRLEAEVERMREARQFLVFDGDVGLNCVCACLVWDGMNSCRSFGLLPNRWCDGCVAAWQVEQARTALSPATAKETT